MYIEFVWIDVISHHAIRHNDKRMQQMEEKGPKSTKRIHNILICINVKNVYEWWLYDVHINYYVMGINLSTLTHHHIHFNFNYVSKKRSRLWKTKRKNYPGWGKMKKESSNIHLFGTPIPICLLWRVLRRRANEIVGRDKEVLPKNK